MKKATLFFPYIVIIIRNQLNIKKIKSTNIILGKNHKKTQKQQPQKTHVGEHCSNLQCFKEKNFKTKFSTNSILKK